MISSVFHPQDKVGVQVMPEKQSIQFSLLNHPKLITAKNLESNEVIDDLLISAVERLANVTMNKNTGSHRQITILTRVIESHISKITVKENTKTLADIQFHKTINDFERIEW